MLSSCQLLTVLLSSIKPSFCSKFSFTYTYNCIIPLYCSESRHSLSPSFCMRAGCQPQVENGKHILCLPIVLVNVFEELLQDCLHNVVGYIDFDNIFENCFDKCFYRQKFDSLISSVFWFYIFFWGGEGWAAFCQRGLLCILNQHFLDGLFVGKKNFTSQKSQFSPAFMTLRLIFAINCSKLQNALSIILLEIFCQSKTMWAMLNLKNDLTLKHIFPVLYLNTSLHLEVTQH